VLGHFLLRIKELRNARVADRSAPIVEAVLFLFAPRPSSDHRGQKRLPRL
jgi:hypothetical protein